MVVSVPEKSVAKDPTIKSGPGWLRRIAPFVAWQLIALLFVELVLYSAGLGEEEVFRIDRQLGTRHIPYKRVTWRSEGFAQSQFDGDGMREPGLTVAKPANTYRIALLGDSMVEGLQVPIDRTFGQMLAKRLTIAGGQQVQVLNFGVSGYSTVQEYLQLKQQVLKYKPDLVVLCYNSRDVFENWAPPDQMLTNVRPLALRLPGSKLIVTNGPVINWMRSPRAQFLMKIEWLREHSRIWGLISALELEWGFHNPAYKLLMSLLTDPRKFTKDLAVSFKNMTSSAPSFQIKTFEDKPLPAVGVKSAQPKTDVKPELISAAPNTVLEKNPIVKAAKDKAPNGGSGKSTVAGEPSNRTYATLIRNTLSGLFEEMRRECSLSGAKFVVVTLPVRAALCPMPAMETAFFNIDYGQEIQMVTDICRQQRISMLDCQTIASKLNPSEQLSLFYMVHLTPHGHDFMMDTLYPFLKSQMR